MSLNTGNSILSNAITVDSSYNVGIGGSPSGSYKFEVTGTGNFSNTLRAASSSFPLDIYGNTNNYGLRINNVQAASLFLYSSYANSGNRNWGLFTNSQVFGDFDIRQSNAKDGDMTAGANSTSRLYIKNDGNIGINTTDTGNGQVTIYNTSGNTLSLKKSSGAGALMFGSDTTNYGLIESINGGGLIFYAGNSTLTEKVRITNGGCLAINSPSDKSEPLSVQGFSGNWTAFFQGSTATSNSYGPIVYAGTTSADQAFYVASASGGTVFFRIRGDNLIFMPQLAAGTMSMSAGGYITTSSDATLKTEDGYIDNGLEKVLQLKPRYFYWNEESGFEDKERQLGFFAQEVNEVLGDEVASNKGENGKWGIHDRGIIAHLVKAIQEQQSKIEELEGKLNRLYINHYGE